MKTFCTVVFWITFLSCFSGVINGQTSVRLADSDARLLPSDNRYRISHADEAAGIGGELKLMVEIDKTGTVTKAYVYIGPGWPCSSPVEESVMKIVREAEAAVMKYKFAPRIKDGKPVDSRISFPIPLVPSKKANSDEFEGKSDKPDSINAEVINGKALVLQRPLYPVSARAAGVSGKVIVSVIVDETGRVEFAQATEGPSMLHFEARRAACASSFSITKLNGKPIRLKGQITYNFVQGRRNLK